MTPGVLAAARGYRPPAERSELDRWILSELNRTAAAVVERMDQYDNYAACGRLIEFVDALSNWYVRRSRDRFWSSEASATRADAYWTLYECLLTTSKLIAPFVPFLAEAMWQNLAVAASSVAARGAEAAGRKRAPVRLSRRATRELIDEGLSDGMALVAARSCAWSQLPGWKLILKFRQPRAKIEVVFWSKKHLPWIKSHVYLIEDEVNVEAVEFPR